MCGRFTRFKTWQEVHDALTAFLDEMDAPNDYTTSYNVAPTQAVLAVAGRSGSLRAAMVRWGLVPFWAKEIPKSAMFNARSETVAEKPAFQTGWKKRRRCLVVADGYYEWHTDGKDKQPYRVHLPYDPVFCFAGLWAHNDNLDITSCTILTTEAPPHIRHLHPRMPVILKPEAYRPWLSAATTPEEAAGIASDNLGNDLIVYRVSHSVGNVRNNSAELLEPVG